MDYLFAKLDNLFFLSTLHTPMALSQYIHSTEKIGNQFTDLKNQQPISIADNIGSYRQ